ncbi:MAG: DUF4435 domain-containing protein [Desulfomicrobium sp.]
MKKILRYTEEENLTRIKMQKNTKFIIVEGADDVPIYETIFNSHVIELSLDVDFEVVYGGGKSKITSFAQSYCKNNFRAILDLDFDHNEKISDHRLRYLDAYSIENYYFSRIVLSYLLANILKLKMKDVLAHVDLTEWHSHVNDECFCCLKHLYFYQKNYNYDKSKWSNMYICKDNGCWEIDKTKINLILTKIIDETCVTDQEIDDFFNSTFPSYDKITKVFPGKMIFHSFYRYVKQYMEKNYSGIFSANFTNDKSFKNASTTYLKFNTECRKILHPIFNYLIDPI